MNHFLFHLTRAVDFAICESICLALVCSTDDLQVAIIAVKQIFVSWVWFAGRENFPPRAGFTPIAGVPAYYASRDTWPCSLCEWNYHRGSRVRWPNNTFLNLVSISLREDVFYTTALQGLHYDITPGLGIRTLGIFYALASRLESRFEGFWQGCNLLTVDDKHARQRSCLVKLVAPARLACAHEILPKVFPHTVHWQDFC